MKVLIKAGTRNFQCPSGSHDDLVLALAIHAVPEAQRVFYVERDGKFHLDVEGREDWPRKRPH